jgi:hypothetical protein
MKYIIGIVMQYREEFSFFKCDPLRSTLPMKAGERVGDLFRASDVGGDQFALNEDAG